MMDPLTSRINCKSGIFVLVASILLLSGQLAVGQPSAQAPNKDKPTNPLPFDLQQPYIPVQTESHPCQDSDWQFLDAQSVRSLVADYGFQILPPLTCVAASVPWLPSAKILRVHESIGLDDYREFSILQSSKDSRLWVIPIEFGMILYAHVEENPHNIAAFNDLLRSATRKPDENLLLELGNLYQFLLGAEEWLDPEQMPKTVEDSLKVNDVSGMITHVPDGVTYKHREFDGDKWTHNYMIWEFNFKKTKEGLRLDSVERGPLDPATDDRQLM